MNELVLTGYDPFWPEREKEALYLGTWCFTYQPRHHFIECKEFAIAPSPWRQWKDLREATEYELGLADRMLAALTVALNSFHGVDRHERFYGIIYGFWMICWLGIVDDRFRRLDAVSRSGEFLVNTSNFGQASWSGKDVASALRGYAYRHDVNLLLFTQLLEYFRWPNLHPQMGTVSIVDNDSGGGEFESPLYRESKNPSHLSRLKRFFKSGIGEIQLRRKRSELFARHYIGYIEGLSDEDRLALIKNSDPYRWFRKRAVEFPIVVRSTPGLRNLHLAFDARTPFEEFIARHFFSSLPDDLCVAFEESLPPGRRTAGRTWIGSDPLQSSGMAARVAFLVERGGRWIGVQHGGGYGVSDIATEHRFAELKMSDKFVTWGWTKYRGIDPSELISLPPPLLNANKPVPDETRDDTLLFVGYSCASYTYWLQGWKRNEDAVHHFEDKIRFLRALDRKKIRTVIYKASITDYGMNEAEHVQKVPGVQYTTEGTFRHLAGSVKAVCVDSLSTAMHEALAWNVPTFFFWQEDFLDILPEAKKPFDRLREIGIWASDPLKAAMHVNEVWPNLHEWWYSDSVQSARADFLDVFGKMSSDWKRDWVAFLNEKGPGLL